MQIDGAWFKDGEGRSLIVRGANLGGSSKVPHTPDGATWRLDSFFDHRKVSFIGRPFPLEEADEHFARLRAWGLTFLRLLTTWEAIEHAGPGEYDEDYLDYFRSIVKKASEYNIAVFIDPHQDVWSRFTGGDGAPGWTLEAVGLDVTKLHKAGAAFVHAVHGDPYPCMIWPINYTLLAAATMFTLFFAGNDFAQATRIDGVPVQEYLQSHYIAAMQRLAERLNDLDNVVGYDVLNEPGTGFIGVTDLAALPQRRLRLHGTTISPFQSMLAGAGYPQEVSNSVGAGGESEQYQVRSLGSAGVSVWRAGYDPVWKANGVWSDDGGAPRLLKPAYFASVKGRSVDFSRDYLKPFAVRYIEAIREAHPGTFLFMEGTPGGTFEWGPDDPPDIVHASHWYDVLTLHTKHYDPHHVFDRATGDVLPVEDKRAFMVEQLAGYRQRAVERMGGIPTLIGEFGIPFDLDGAKAYQTGDFSVQIAALDAMYSALDANLLSGTIWNYTADNTNERGDMWNDEDLSIFSRDQQHNPHDIHFGGRALEAVSRPYPMATAGEPLLFRFDLPTRTCEFTFRADPAMTAPTLIFIPPVQYPAGILVDLSAGSYAMDGETHCLVIDHGGTGQVIVVTVRPNK